jgi:hypothetical protein
MDTRVGVRSLWAHAFASGGELRVWIHEGTIVGTCRTRNLAWRAKVMTRPLKGVVVTEHLVAKPGTRKIFHWEVGTDSGTLKGRHT